ncbi:MAG: hypothetical protein Q9214_003809 [Letrouitia sp. 1 TL-2023]
MTTSSIIAVVGGINMDLVFETERAPDKGESLDAKSIAYFPGGKGANTAIALHRTSHTKPANTDATIKQDDGSGIVDRHDIRVFMNSAVGDDQFGVELKATLENHGINISGVQTVKGPSGICCVVVEIKNGASRGLAYQAANLEWNASDPHTIESLACGFRPDLVITHLGIPRKRIEKILETATKAGVDTILNPSPADYLVITTYKNVTHLILNKQEAAHLTAQEYADLATPVGWAKAAAYFVDKGVDNVVITLAEKGAYFATRGEKKGKIDAVKDVAVKDTTGAGDTFVGMYAVEVIQQKKRGQWDIEAAIKRACKASARTIERLGAQESIPWLDEIDG